MMRLHSKEEEEQDKEERNGTDCDPNKVLPIGVIGWIPQADLKCDWMKIEWSEHWSMSQFPFQYL